MASGVESNESIGKKYTSREIEGKLRGAANSSNKDKVRLSELLAGGNETVKNSLLSNGKYSAYLGSQKGVGNKNKKKKMDKKFV